MEQLIYSGISLCAFGTIFLSVAVYKYRQKGKNERAIFTDKTLRSPGQSLSEQIRALDHDITINSIYAVIFQIFVFSYAFILDINLIYYFAVIALFDLIYFIILYKTINKKKRLRLKYDGEIAVGQEINRLMLDGYYVFHDLVRDKLKKFNIDHIVVGSSGIYVIETKTHLKYQKGVNSGTINYDGNSIKFPDGNDSSAINQVIRHTFWLNNWLRGEVGGQVDVEPIVVLPGWYINRIAKNGIEVLNPVMVSTYLKNKKEKKLSPKMVQQIVEQLSRKCRDIDLMTYQIPVEAV